MNYIHWHIQIDNQDILWAGLDRHGKSLNTIDVTVLNELSDIIEQRCKGIVFFSLKKKGFIAGADIDTFSHYSEAEVENFIQLGQAVFDKLANLSIPTIALIDGFCLGGGLELALACQYRIVTEKTVIGLPEVQLGIIPAWGGVKRSIQLMGTFKALTCLLLAGKKITANKALTLGVVTIVVPKRQLESAAISILQQSVKFTRTARAYLNLSSIVISKTIRFFLQRRVNPQHYPAPYTILDLVENSQESEVAVIKKLTAPYSTARELIRVFYLKEQLKHLASDNNRLLSKKKARQHIHIAGAGTMGADIAAVCALKGFYVTLSDINFEALGKALVRAKKYFDEHSRNKFELQVANDCFTLDFEANGIKKADIIIEAIVENLNVKQTFFKEVEKIAKSTAILVTNTSSLSIKNIAATMQKKHRLVGIHFFNPATKMPLVEVIFPKQPPKESDAARNKTENSSAKSIHTELFTETLAFVSQIGKLPVPVKDSPGFLVNRVLTPYLLNGLELIGKGIEPEKIDAAAQNFGMLMGPIELADTIGLDVCLAVANNLSAVDAESNKDGSLIALRILEKKVAEGKLGKKTRSGFFRYNKRERKISPWLSKITWQKQSMFELEKIAEKLITPIILEAKLCLEEGVVENKDLLDAAMIFGAGFAPFRGGPMQYAANLSLNSVNNREKSEK